jgi:NADH dehydrogenase/NADH:ubiquinone oxidoreductase subunit G
MSIEITIDGKSCVCDPGEYLASVAARNDIFIPTLCGTNEALLGRGSCRVCIVEVVESSRKKIVASCIYPVMKPCEVFTNSERITRERGVILAFLQRLAPDSKRIADMARTYGSYDIPELESLEVLTDGSTCILCGLCVEACKMLGAEAISTVGRGVAKQVSTPYDDASPYCIGCASCAAVCPTGSIDTQTMDDVRVIWGREFRIVRCEVCGEEIGTEESLAYAEKRAFAQRGSEKPYQAGAQPQRLCSKHKSQQVAAGLIAAD